MDELAGLDRLDQWLNGQRGWRRFVVWWVMTGPAIVWIGVCVREIWHIVGQAPAGPLVFGAASAVVALPVACVLAVVSDRRMRRSPGTAWPLLSWRGIGWGLLLTFFGAVLEAVQAPGSGWAHHHSHDVGWIIVALTVAFLALMFSGLRTRKRRYLARQESSPVAVATAQWPPRWDAP